MRARLLAITLDFLPPTFQGQQTPFNPTACAPLETTKPKGSEATHSLRQTIRPSEEDTGVALIFRRVGSLSAGTKGVQQVRTYLHSSQARVTRRRFCAEVSEPNCCESESLLIGERVSSKAGSCNPLFVLEVAAGRSSSFAICNRMHQPQSLPLFGSV